MVDNQLPEHGDTPLSLAYFLGFDLPLPTRILDIGTRFGSFVNAVNGRGYANVVGLDIDADAIRTGRAAYPHLGQKLQVYDGKALPFPPGAFDVVTGFDVLEHIPDPDAFLREVLRVLAPGGRLIFQTPNIYINIPWEIVQHRSLTKWRTFHCSLQSLRSLRSLLVRAGFAQVRIEKFDRHSDFKDRHARAKLGPLGPLAIRLAKRMPLPLYPNFWGHAVRPGGRDE